VVHGGVSRGDSPQQALKKMILPEEVARLVLFLASDDSSAITNQSYVIDGGWV
jgi:NAD(P)-dependent dehydrogenase (short-subunit alcohol dehydrogenase family)